MHKLVPDLILQNLDQQQSNGQFEAVCLFVDTSGFTPLTVALMAEDSTGAEVIADVLATIFAPLVQIIYEQGGFVAGFAGDAFKAIFPTASFPKNQAYERAVIAAWHIKQHMVGKMFIDTRFGDFDFAVKITVASGEVSWGIWRGEFETGTSLPNGQRATCYFEGAALAHCLEADPFAGAGEIVLTSDVAEQLPNTAVSLQPVDVYFRLDDVTDDYVASMAPLSIKKTPVEQSQAAIFFPKALINMPTRGEFRQVVTSFVNLQSLPNDTNFGATLFDFLDQYGGYLCRVGRIGDKDPGATLLLFWGAPHSYENNVTRALRFTLALREALATPLKAGITTNLAYAGFIGAPQREEYTCHGTHVNLAARQMVAAQWGEIWLDDETSRQAETVFDIIPGEEYHFKGFTKKRPVFFLQGQHEVPNEPLYRGPLIGRKQELLQLKTAVQPLKEGRLGGVITIVGEAGVGKSRLVHEFLEQSEVLDTAVHFICQTDDILRQSLNPFRYFLADYFDQSLTQSEVHNKQRFNQILDSLIEDSAVDDLDTELDRTRSLLATLLNLSMPDRLFAQLNPKLRFENTLAALKTLIKAESRRQPLIIHLEDAHWLDADSFTFINNLTTNIVNYPILLIITARPQQLENKFLTELVSDEIPHTSIQLTTLTNSELTDLAAAHLKGPLSADLSKTLSERADGNPFFAEQILLFLQEQALLSRNGHGWELATDSSATLGLPTDVRTVMVTRLDQLPPPVKQTVQTASILGREFGVPVLTKMLSEETAVLQKVKAAETAVIWTALDSIRYRFQHALLKDAAYEMQLQTQRRSLHQQAAVAIETLYVDELTPHFSELAYHYEQAEAIERARHYLKQAGDTAQAAFQNAAAVDYYDRLLSLLPVKIDGPVNATAVPETAVVLMMDTLLEKGRVLQMTGQLELAQATLSAALQVAEQYEDIARQAKVKLALSEVAGNLGQNDEGLLLARQSLAYYETSNDENGHKDTMHRIAQIYNNMGKHEEAQRQFHELLEIVETTDDPQRLANVINGLAISYSQKGDDETAERYCERAVAISQEAGDKHSHARTLNTLSIASWFQYKYDQALAAAQKSIQINREIGNRQGVANTTGNMASIYLNMGDFDQALDCNERAIQLAQELGKEQSIAILLGNMANIYRRMKEYDKALQVYDEAIPRLRQMKADYFASIALIFNAAILFRQGEYTSAKTLNDEGLEMAIRSDRTDAIIIGQVYTAKLDYVRGEIEKAQQHLRSFLQKEEYDKYQARLQYELWWMNAGEDHGQQAIALYLASKDDLLEDDLERLSELETAFG